MTSTQAFAQFIAESERLVFLTGAGMSTESGIPDFRSASGLYANGVGERIFDIDEFDQNPDLFHTHIHHLAAASLGAKPNPGHLAVAALEHDLGKTVTVVTQNIDSLHQAAGSTHVLSLHGQTDTCTCRRCGEQRFADELWRRVFSGKGLLRHIGCGGVFKPDIVFFGEPLPLATLAGAGFAMREADLVIVAGTSLAVYPAAALPSYRSDASRLVVINQTPTPIDDQAELVFHASISTVLTRACSALPYPE